MVQSQGQEFRFRCPSCGHSSDVPAITPESQGIAACPWCGLTIEEGQHALNDELSRMFNRGMQLSSVPAASGGPISSATVAALGFGSNGGGGSGRVSGMGLGGGSGPSAPDPPQGYTGPAAIPSTLGYNVSQHYHHSTHITTPSVGSTRPVSADAALGGSSSNNSGGGGGGGSSSGEADMQMDADAPASARSLEDHQVEPYMKSGYEYLAERDYNRQAGGPGRYTQALDPAFSSKEWWRDFHAQPIEFQYGMFQQMSEGLGRENEAPHQGEEEHMVL